MRTVLAIGVLLWVPALAAANEPGLPDYGPPVAEPARADVERPAPVSAAARHANPRAKLSYRRFAVSGLDGNPIPLDGGQLDVYPLSRRWVRIGFEAEVGSGSSASATAAAHLWYGLIGLTAGIQYPARVTPFVEGRAGFGVLGGSMSGTTTLAGAAISSQGFNAATLLYLGGIDVGVEVYAAGRAYVSVALGWAHPVYLGLAPVALQATGSIQTTRVSTDTFTFKLGAGF